MVRLAAGTTHVLPRPVTLVLDRLNAVHGLAPTLLALLLASTLVALAAPRWWAPVLAVQALSWPLLNKQLEGPILWAVTFGGRAHGLSVTDLAAPLALAVAVRCLRRRGGRAR